MRRTVIASALLFGLAGPAAAEEYALIHGNYCGFQKIVGPDGADLPPVDVLDAICMRHDYCYERRGVSDCSCDLDLMREVSNRRWADGRSINLARVVFYGIAAKPCTDLNGQLRKIEFARQAGM